MQSALDLKVASLIKGMTMGRHDDGGDDDDDDDDDDMMPMTEDQVRRLEHTGP
jgi:hypothetical protein